MKEEETQPFILLKMFGNLKEFFFFRLFVVNFVVIYL